MAWDEWEQLKAEAAARHDSGMRLNSAGGHAGAPDLKTDAPGKRGAVEALRERIRPGVDRAGVHADEDSDAAEGEFKGWATGAGLRDAHREWALQVKSFKARLEQDQAALGKAKSDLQYADHETWRSINAVDVPESGPRRSA